MKPGGKISRLIYDYKPLGAKKKNGQNANFYWPLIALNAFLRNNPYLNVRPISDTRNGTISGTLGYYPF